MKGLMDQLIPKNRIVSDKRKVLYYFRPSPNRSHIVFGGRVSLGESNPRLSGSLTILWNLLGWVLSALEQQTVRLSGIDVM